MTKERGPNCPLCGHASSRLIARLYERDYFACPECRLRFVDPEALPTQDEERAVYDTHQNSPEDPGYRRFLGKLTEALVPKLSRGARGLDYGAGPGPTLSVLLGELGFSVVDYDPIYAPDASLLRDTYDFVVCSETVEHFHRPARDFSKMCDLLEPGGWLGVMTEIFDPKSAFAEWWYHRDPTHVSFYELETLRWVATHHGFGFAHAAPNVTLFRKPLVTGAGEKGGAREVAPRGARGGSPAASSAHLLTLRRIADPGVADRSSSTMLC